MQHYCTAEREAKRERAERGAADAKEVSETRNGGKGRTGTARGGSHGSLPEERDTVHLSVDSGGNQKTVLDVKVSEEPLSKATNVFGTGIGIFV